MRSFLIWETDDDLPAPDWVQEIARDIWRDILWLLPNLTCLAACAGIIAWIIMPWI